MNPVYKKYVPSGEGHGVSITLWNNNLQLQRQEKTDGKWNTKKDFNLSPSVLKELIWLIPKAIETIQENRKKNS